MHRYLQKDVVLSDYDARLEYQKYKIYDPLFDDDNDYDLLLWDGNRSKYVKAYFR